MAGDWRQRCLGELTDNFDSRRVPVNEADRRRGTYPYYGASGVVDHVDGYLFDGEYLLIAEDGENLRTRNTPIAFLVRGKFWVNNHAHIVRGNSEANTRYLLYALQAADIGGYLTGSTMPKLTQGAMNRILVPVPAPHEQRAIAQLLGALDDKIELNRRMNQTLESMARAIFRSWFVDFDPVGAKVEGRQPFGMSAEVAALFPGEFRESELGAIPKGWIVESIGDRASRIQYGYTQSGSRLPVGPKFLRITDIQGGRVDWGTVPYCECTPKDFETYRICAGDILVARTGASTGENIYITGAPVAVFASYLVRVQFANRNIARVVGQFMRTEEYFSYIEGSIGGSAQPNAGAPVLTGARLAFPPAGIAEAFYSLVEPCDLQRLRNMAESRTLAALRDALLPKLMSGELRVRDAEKLAGIHA